MRNAVHAIVPGGGSILEAGLEMGCQQVLANYRGDYTNRVLFLSDGTENSSRLRRTGAETGDVRISLLWDNRNDLDLYVIEPSGDCIFYGNTVSRVTGGMLDVDVNVRGETTKPVENIFWPKGMVPEGRLRVFVQLYGFHEPHGMDTNYAVEIYNRGEYQRFKGTIRGGTRPRSNIEITELIYRPSEEGRDAVRGVLNTAETNKSMGIGISTIGAGQDLDQGLMSDLAACGGGSSRFVVNRQTMEAVFGSELDRMIVTAATDVEIAVTLAPGVELADTWGYEYRVEGNVVRYRMDTVHNRNYETILMRLRYPAISPGQEFVAGTVDTRFKAVTGEQAELGPISIVVTAAADNEHLSGVSTYRVIRSMAMLEFVESLREIGGLFYQGGRSRTVSAQGVQNALELTRAAKANLLSAQRRLDDVTFEDKLAILENYFEILGTYPELERSEMARTFDDESLPLSGGRRTTITQLTNLFGEIALHLRETDGSVAVTPFFIRTNVAYPREFNEGMRAYVQQVATTVVASATGVRLIDTDRIETELRVLGMGLADLRDTVHALEMARQLHTDAIVTGTMIEMSESFVMFARVVDRRTEEVLAAARVVLDKATVMDDLLGPF